MTENEFTKEFNAEECADIREFLYEMMEKRIKCVDRSDASTVVEMKDDGIKLLTSSSVIVGDENEEKSSLGDGEPKRKKPRKHRKVDSSDSDSDSDDEEKRQRKFESISVDAGFVTQFK